jgi:hypothetical protein
MKKLTTFEGWLLFYAISLLIIVGLIVINCVVSFIVAGILFFIILMISMAVSEDLRDVISFKYKIIEKDGWFGSKEFRVKYLTIFYLFIPYWKTMKTEVHSFKSQNIFGAKYKAYFESEATFKSKEYALEGIKKHKEDMKWDSDRFFKRRKTEKSKTIYVK